MDTYSYKISASYLSAIINGDFSDLDDHEVELVSDFESFISTEHGIGHWSCETDYSDDFAQCDICFKFSNCVSIEWVTMWKITHQKTIVYRLALLRAVLSLNRSPLVYLSSLLLLWSFMTSLAGFLIDRAHKAKPQISLQLIWGFLFCGPVSLWAHRPVGLWACEPVGT